eukprot:gnl/TRDRNA2_/TRDRNA2_166848_c0_seq2.p1 gnl/TRDRNA2_/TRDRNA2_166848_c0~~gnl/TRDRNA2_/TRDRNA2_166848_c0_seq2.p1  ORF type:complete len:117 (+),score=0.09 gnl/TRDRNA2_/TRDRNA2_166848_c0_seq2:108-458(+)
MGLSHVNSRLFACLSKASSTTMLAVHISRSKIAEGYQMAACYTHRSLQWNYGKIGEACGPNMAPSQRIILTQEMNERKFEVNYDQTGSTIDLGRTASYHASHAPHTRWGVWNAWPS